MHPLSSLTAGLLCFSSAIATPVSPFSTGIASHGHLNSTCRVSLGKEHWISKGCHKHWSAPHDGLHSGLLHVHKNDTSFSSLVAQALGISERHLKDLAALRPTAIEIPIKNPMYSVHCMKNGAVDWDGWGGVNDKMRLLHNTAFAQIAANYTGPDKAAFEFVLRKALAEVFDRVDQYREDRETLCETIDPLSSPEHWVNIEEELVFQRNGTSGNGTLYHSIPLEMAHLQNWLNGGYGLKKSDINIDTLKKFTAHYYQALSPAAKLSIAQQAAIKVHGNITSNDTILHFFDKVPLHKSRAYWFDPVLYIFDKTHFLDGKHLEAHHSRSLSKSHTEVFSRMLVVPFIKEHNLKHDLDSNLLLKDMQRKATEAARLAVQVDKAHSHGHHHAKINATAANKIHSHGHDHHFKINVAVVESVPVKMLNYSEITSHPFNLTTLREFLNSAPADTMTDSFSATLHPLNVTLLEFKELIGANWTIQSSNSTSALNVTVLEFLESLPANWTKNLSTATSHHLKVVDQHIKDIQRHASSIAVKYVLGLLNKTHSHSPSKHSNVTIQFPNVTQHHIGGEGHKHNKTRVVVAV